MEFVGTQYGWQFRTVKSHAYIEHWQQMKREIKDQLSERLRSVTVLRFLATPLWERLFLTCPTGIKYRIAQGWT